MKNILFIGGTGLLAINWANQVKDQCHVFLGTHSRFVTLSGIKTVSLKSNLSEFESFIIENSIESVINCAGITSVELCERNPDLAFEVNSELPKNLAIVCNKLNVKLVHISTDHLFVGDHQFVSEKNLPYPVNIYGKSKLEGEFNVLNQNSNALVIRTNFFGWGTTYRKSFSDYIITELRNKNEIKLFNDVFYTPILIEPLVNYVTQLMDLNFSGIFNVVSSERMSKYDFGQKIAKAFNLSNHLIKSIQFSSRLDLITRPLDLSLSNNKLAISLKTNIESIDDQIRSLVEQENKPSFKEIINL